MLSTATPVSFEVNLGGARPGFRVLQPVSVGIYSAEVMLTPRYDGDPVLTVEAGFGDPSDPLVRQRRRLGTILASLNEEQWFQPTRCERWNVKDVAAHLVTINELWIASMSGGLAGAPTELFRGFDPAVTPALLVDAVRDWTTTEVLRRYLATTEELAAAASEIGVGAWSLMGDTPLGRGELRAVASHALWDAWVHERDIVLPLGLELTEEPDEVILCLAYVAALGPALRALEGSVREGSLVLDVLEPSARVVVEFGPSVLIRRGSPSSEGVTLTGRAASLADRLSFRTVLELEVPRSDEWVLKGLDVAFDHR